MLGSLLLFHFTDWIYITREYIRPDVSYAIYDSDTTSTGNLKSFIQEQEKVQKIAIETS